MLRPASDVGTFDLVVWSGRNVQAELPPGKCWRDVEKGDSLVVDGRKAHVLEVRIAACEPVWGSTNGQIIVSGRDFEETGRHLDE